MKRLLLLNKINVIPYVILWLLKIIQSISEDNLKEKNTHIINAIWVWIITL